MKRGALLLLCDSDSERERENHLGSLSLRCGICRDRMRERERESSREAGIITHCLCIQEYESKMLAWRWRDRALMLFLMKKYKINTLFTPLRSFTLLQCHNYLYNRTEACVYIHCICVCVYSFRCFGFLILFFLFYSSLSRVEVCSHLVADSKRTSRDFSGNLPRGPLQFL